MRRKTALVVVTADFGHGKSLTARALARDLAREYLTGAEPGPSLPMPVFIKCVDDLTSQDLDVRKMIQSGFHNGDWNGAGLTTSLLTLGNPTGDATAAAIASDGARGMFALGYGVNSSGGLSFGSGRSNRRCRER